MKIPGSASDDIMEDMPSLDDAYVTNPYAGKEMLTFLEALDLISAVSSELYADGNYRSFGNRTSKEQHKE